MSSNPVQVVIADEHVTFRQSIRTCLEAESGFRIVGETSDAKGAALLVGRLKPDILLIDFALSQLVDIQNSEHIGNALPSPRVVIMLSVIDKGHTVDAFRMGAHGVVPKGSISHALLPSIRSVMAGHYWLETQNVGDLVVALRGAQTKTHSPASPKTYGLTKREIDIIAMIVNGHSNHEVGREFSISERTVKHHLTNIFSKVGVSSRLQLALFAVHHDFIGSRMAVRHKDV